MTITASPRTHAVNDLPSTKNALVGQRVAVAGALTAFAVGLGVAIAALFGSTVFFLFAVTLPPPLIVLWLATDVVRADERGAGR